jgi:hypothetical protein
MSACQGRTLISTVFCCCFCFRRCCRHVVALSCINLVWRQKQKRLIFSLFFNALFILPFSTGETNVFWILLSPAYLVDCMQLCLHWRESCSGDKVQALGTKVISIIMWEKLNSSLSCIHAAHCIPLSDIDNSTTPPPPVVAFLEAAHPLQWCMKNWRQTFMRLQTRQSLTRDPNTTIGYTLST